MEAERGVVVRRVERADSIIVDGFAHFGVATVHEAQGRTGLLAARIDPVWPGARISGSAVTVAVPVGDNWMIHVAVEQCQEGDVMIVAPEGPSEHGYLGELIATALQARGVRGFVIDAGVRDIADLRELAFPVWSATISALGTVKEELGTVNLPIVCAGQAVAPGDVVVADDDGVCIVPRDRAPAVLQACHERAQKENAARGRYATGELTLDVTNLREALEQKGLRYLD